MRALLLVLALTASPVTAASVGLIAIPPSPSDTVARFGTNEPLQKISLTYELTSDGRRVLISNLDVSDGFELEADVRGFAHIITLRFHTSAGLETHVATGQTGRNAIVIEQVQEFCPSPPCTQVQWIVNDVDQMLPLHAAPLFESTTPLVMLHEGSADVRLSDVTTE